MNSFLAVSGVSNLTTDILFTVLFLVFSIAVILICVFLLTRFIGKPKGSIAIKATGLVLMILAIGLVVRLIFTFIIRGYRPEFNIFTTLMDYANASNFLNFYKIKGITLYPVTVYIYSVMGWFMGLFGLTGVSALSSIFVKLPLIVCDLATACILYKVAKKYINEYVGLIICGFFCLFPLFIFASSVWASTFSLLSLFLVLTMYFIVEKKYLAVIGMYSISLLTSHEALFLFPLIAVVLVYHFIKSVKILRKEPCSFGEVMKSEQKRGVVLIPAGIVISTILMYLITLPLIWSTNEGGNFFAYINTFFIKTLTTFGYFSYNALSIFNIFGRNGVDLGSTFPSYIFSIIFAVIITVIVILMYLSKKNRANLVFLASYIILTLSIYFIDFTALAILPALIILLFSFLVIRDKRILQIFSVMSFAALFNACAVMISAGYLNNAVDFIVSGDNIFYTGSTLLLGGFGVTISIICSVLAIFAHLYATLVLLDISLANKRKQLLYDEKATFLKSLKNFIK